MNENNNNELIEKAFTCGYNLLNSDIKVKSSDVEDLANLKAIIRSILSGELVVLDKKLFEELNSTKEEN